MFLEKKRHVVCSVVDRMNMKYADMHIKYAGGLQMFLLLEFLGFFNQRDTTTTHHFRLHTAQVLISLAKCSSGSQPT